MESVPMRAFATPALAFLCASCNPQSLQGSLTVLLNLEYQSADLSIANNQAALRFLDPRDISNAPPDAGAAGQDVVLKVITNLNGQTVTANHVFDLSATLPTGGQVGSLSRNVYNDPVTSFPPIRVGQFVVHQTPTSGSTVGGYFSVTFQDGIDPACGRTVYADFKAKVL